MGYVVSRLIQSLIESTDKALNQLADESFDGKPEASIVSAAWSRYVPVLMRERRMTRYRAANNCNITHIRYLAKKTLPFVSFRAPLL